MALRLGTLWFVTLAAVGYFYPYYSLYLKEILGFSATQVGTVIAVQPLVGCLAQPLWGHFADRTGSRRRALALAIFGFGLGALLISQASGYWAVLAATACFALCSTSVIAMTTAVSLAALPNVKLARPEAAFYAFFSIDGIEDSVPFAQKLVRENKVGIAPGAAFGPGGEGFVRLNFGCPRSTLLEGLEKLRNALEDL